MRTTSIVPATNRSSHWLSGGMKDPYTHWLIRCFVSNQFDVSSCIFVDLVNWLCVPVGPIDIVAQDVQSKWMFDGVRGWKDLCDSISFQVTWCHHIQHPIHPIQSICAVICKKKKIQQELLDGQWWIDLFRCRIDLLNFSMGIYIVAPYMVCVTHKWISPSLWWLWSFGASFWPDCSLYIWCYIGCMLRVPRWSYKPLLKKYHDQLYWSDGKPFNYEWVEGKWVVRYLATSNSFHRREKVSPCSQAYIPRRRTFIQVLPPLNAYTKSVHAYIHFVICFCCLLMHICILPENCNCHSMRTRLVYALSV